MKRKIVYKDGLPEDVIDLIDRILRIDVNERLPLIEVFNHPWIKRMQEKHNL